MKRKTALLLAMIIVVSLLAACGGGGEPAAATSSDAGPDSFTAIDPNTINVLTGGERPVDMYEGQRPVAVMVSNDIYSMPQRGIAAADVIYEMVTEGGVTRLMAMYADYRTLPVVGPVRSVRDQQVQLAVPANAILTHIGSSAYARNLLNVLAYQDVDGIYLGKTAFFFDDTTRVPPYGSRNEYCWFTDAGRLWDGMERMDVHTTGEVPALFNFGYGLQPQGAAAEEISVVYSAAAYSGFQYDAAAGLYLKSIFGGAHMDENGTQLAFKNVLILTTDITLKVDGQCTEFDFSAGQGVYFMGGVAQEITWIKGGPAQPLQLFDKDGYPLLVESGKSYIGFVDSLQENAVTFIPGGVDAVSSAPESAPSAQA